jgi:hypothetical protein
MSARQSLRVMIMESIHSYLPVPTLLSHALAAFTTEFDDEAEQLPLTTTRNPKKRPQKFS